METEHLGNADAYRVTREIPLPYRNLDPDSDEDADGKSLKKVNPVKARWRAVLDRMRDASGHEHDHDHQHQQEQAHNGAAEMDAENGREDDEHDQAKLARARTREYEARRPGEGTVRSGHMEVVEDKWLTLVRRLRERKRKSDQGQAPS